MERLRHDLYFWTIIYHYVTKHDCHLLHKNECEVLLLDDHQKKIFRFVRIDLDWANVLRRDVEDFVKRLEFVRRQLRFRRVDVENVYVSVYPPVDDWSDVTTSIQNGNVTVYTSLIHREHRFITNEPDRNLSLPNEVPLHTVEQLEQAILTKQREVTRILNKKREEEEAIFSKGKVVATFALLFSIAVMFFVLEINGGSTSLLTLIEYGAKFNPLILEGEWWRLFSAMFLHIGFLHIFMNSLALYYLGSAVERMYGTSRFLFIYFTAGFFGSLASFLFNDQIAAGASGAIFGCFGALLYFGTVHKRLFFRTIGRNVIFILIINIGFGLAMPLVDNGAHIGGLIGGFIAAQIVQLPKQKFSYKQIVAFLLASIAAYSLFTYGMDTKESELSPRLSTQLAQEYITKGDLESAYPLLERAITLDPNIPEVTFMLGYIEGMNENYEKALQYFEKTVELRPELHEAHYNLAIIYFELDEVEKGKEALERALYYAPHDERYVKLKEEVESKEN